MTLVRPNPQQIDLYAAFCHYLNKNNGQLDANDAVYYKFLDDNRVEHSVVSTSVKLCHKMYEGKPFILHLDGRTTGAEGGSFYLTPGGGVVVKNVGLAELPPLLRRPKPPEIELNNPSIPPPTKKAKEPEGQWTPEEVIDLLTRKAHIVGRMLGTGYNLLEPLHSEWMEQWIANPESLRVLIHQAHRDSYKTTLLRLFVATLLILQPLKTIIVIRKSEDAVKEIVNGVSKILDTPLFHTFINILYPDIRNKGGFKKTVDTALAIDTNLNVSLSGEYQLRALGLGSPLTGKHSSIIITDDIVSTADRESDAERRATISKYQEMMNLLSNNKGFSDTRIINIGTPWHEEDAFSLMERGLRDKTEEQEVLEALSAKERTPAQNERIRRLNMKRGKFIYNCYQTGLMTNEDIEWKRKVLNDECLFAANYMLSLVSDEEKPFPKIENVGKYSKTYFEDAWEVFAAIDAAYGGDDTCTLGIGAYDWKTNTVIVYGKLWRGISIDQNYMELAEIMFECGTQTLFMETNTDKGLMGDKFRELGFNVEGYHESQNKHTKIVSTIRPFWREIGDLCLPCVQFVSETDEDYLSQIHNYKKGIKKDDAPDNLACLLLKSKFGALSIRLT